MQIPIALIEQALNGTFGQARLIINTRDTPEAATAAFVETANELNHMHCLHRWSEVTTQGHQSLAWFTEHAPKST